MTTWVGARECVPWQQSPNQEGTAVYLQVQVLVDCTVASVVLPLWHVESFCASVKGRAVLRVACEGVTPARGSQDGDGQLVAVTESSIHEIAPNQLLILVLPY